MRDWLVHIAFNYRLGRLNPYILGLAIGRWPHKRREGDSGLDIEKDNGV
jgi:hypothetical protein